MHAPLRLRELLGGSTVLNANPIITREIEYTFRALSRHAQGEIHQKLAIIQGRADQLALDPKERAASRNAGRIISEAAKELRELLGVKP
jgi:hypothetical protein